jgi:hypothetical protein
VNRSKPQTGVALDGIGSPQRIFRPPRRLFAPRRAAWAATASVSPGGFKSGMRGTKAEHLDPFAARAGRAYRRFDYSGRSLSEGHFDAETIGT